MIKTMCCSNQTHDFWHVLTKAQTLYSLVLPLESIHLLLQVSFLLSELRLQHALRVDPLFVVRGQHRRSSVLQSELLLPLGLVFLLLAYQLHHLFPLLLDQLLYLRLVSLLLCGVEILVVRHLFLGLSVRHSHLAQLSLLRCLPLRLCH